MGSENDDHQGFFSDAEDDATVSTAREQKKIKTENNRLVTKV